MDASISCNQYLITFLKKLILTSVTDTVGVHRGLSHILLQFIRPMLYSYEVYRNPRLSLKPFTRKQIIRWSDQILLTRARCWNQNKFQIALCHRSEPFYSKVTSYPS